MRVKSDWHIHQAKPYFSKKCERARVWAASCERSYEGICFMYGRILFGNKAKADVRRYFFFSIYANKITKTDEYFHFSQVFGRKGVEGRLSRTAACSRLGDMKITIYDTKDFFRSLFRSLFRNLFRSRYSAIIYRKFYRKSLYLSEIYRKFILVPIFLQLWFHFWYHHHLKQDDKILVLPICHAKT